MVFAKTTVFHHLTALALLTACSGGYEIVDDRTTITDGAPAETAQSGNVRQAPDPVANSLNIAGTWKISNPAISADTCTAEVDITKAFVTFQSSSGTYAAKMCMDATCQLTGTSKASTMQGQTLSTPLVMTQAMGACNISYNNQNSFRFSSANEGTATFIVNATFAGECGGMAACSRTYNVRISK